MPRLSIVQEEIPILSLSDQQFLRCEFTKREVDGIIQDVCQLEVLLNDPPVLQSLMGQSGLTVTLSSDDEIQSSTIDSAEGTEYSISLTRTSGKLLERIKISGVLR